MTATKDVSKGSALDACERPHDDGRSTDPAGAASTPAVMDRVEPTVNQIVTVTNESGADTHLFPIPGERGENGELRTQRINVYVPRDNMWLV